jgi:hypothetical protein
MRKVQTERLVVPLCERIPAPTGDYIFDISAGKRSARVLLDEIKVSRGKDRCLLGMMISEMARLGRHENAQGIIVGFMTEIADRIPFSPWESLLREQRLEKAS